MIVIELKKVVVIILVLFGILILFITFILILILCANLITSFIKKKPFPKKNADCNVSWGCFSIFNLYI